MTATDTAPAIAESTAALALQDHPAQTIDLDSSALEMLIAKGDLKALTPDQRADYYMNVCKSIGLNPFTNPLMYITLNGKLTLYATKGATDQLRGKHNVSVEITAQGYVDPDHDYYSATARATTPEGRTDEDTAIIWMWNPGKWVNNQPGPATKMTGEEIGNAIMKCITKAKRRVTLSMFGLGMLDETEVTSIAGARMVEVDNNTGEIKSEETFAQAARRNDPNAPSQQQISLISILCDKLDLSNDERKAMLEQRYNVRSRTLLTKQQAHDLIEFLKPQADALEADEDVIEAQYSDVPNGTGTDAEDSNNEAMAAEYERLQAETTAAKAKAKKAVTNPGARSAGDDQDDAAAMGEPPKQWSKQGKREEEPKDQPPPGVGLTADDFLTPAERAAKFRDDNDITDSLPF